MCSGRSGIEVRPALPGDIGFVRDTLLASWGPTVIAVHGELIEAMEQEALVAWRTAGGSAWRPTAGTPTSCPGGWSP